MTNGIFLTRKLHSLTGKIVFHINGIKRIVIETILPVSPIMVRRSCEAISRGTIATISLAGVGGAVDLFLSLDQYI